MHRSETPGRQPIYQAGDGEPNEPPRRRRNRAGGEGTAPPATARWA